MVTEKDKRKHMALEEDIKEILIQRFQPSVLKLVNESKNHRGHAGDDGSGQTHFKLIIVSEKFMGLTSVARHRLVNEALKQSFSKGLHAISIEAKTPSEQA